MTELDKAQAAQAASGKWHLIGKHGCLNTSQASFGESARVVARDKRRRDWCAYCEERLRLLEARAEISKLRAQRDALRSGTVDDLDESLPEITDGPNHGVDPSLDEAPHSGWGQITQSKDN